MKLTLYQVDAFTNKIFEGNPAAVCPLEEWLPDEIMQSIALENNLSETAYFVETDESYAIRWFTPTTEVDLCGHATLASAYVAFNCLGYKEKEIIFESKSGPLKVAKDGDWLEMNFPSQTPVACSLPDELLHAFSIEPIECLKSEDYIVVFENEEQVAAAEPDLMLLYKLDLRGVIITSSAKDYDFVTRFFAPKFGINEDSVTGSAFTQLIPYWSEKLDKDNLMAKQVSQRGGEIRCVNLKGRVTISGQAIKYMDAVIEVNID